MIIRLSILAFCICFSSIEAFAQEYSYTDGKEIYWEPEEEGDLFDFFKEFYWTTSYSHRLALRDLPLFVRLDDEDYKISKLRENGHTKAIEGIQIKLLERNRKLVEAFQKRYRSDNYYFYYAKDADKIFKNYDFSYLYKDLETIAEFDFGDNQVAYVLIFRQPVKNWDSKEYVMHMWDLEKVSRIRKMEFVAYNSWFSYEVNIDKTIKRLVRYIWDK